MISIKTSFNCLSGSSFCLGSVPEEPGESFCPATEDRGSGEKAGVRTRNRQNGEEEAEEELPGCHAEASGDRGRDEPLPCEEGKETHAESLADHRW